MTQLSEKDHAAQMADMKSFDEQMPCVGIFWYDPEEKSFFGVHKKELTPVMVEEAANKGIPFINYPKLHRQIWARGSLSHTLSSSMNRWNSERKGKLA